MMTPPEEFVARLICHDQKAFRELVIGYQKIAYSMTFRILCNEEEARDAVQDGFVKIWQHLGAYNRHQNLYTWMNTIFIHTALDKLRILKRRNEIRFREVISLIDRFTVETPEHRLENQDLADMIHLLAGKLPTTQRMVFILRDIQGLDSSEVQQMLELSEDQVKSNLYHARKSVRKILTKLMSTERRLL